jgi:CRP/FNR family transcriptional regulator
MIDPDQLERISQVLPILRRADPDMRREFEGHAFLAKIPPGKDVFIQGDHIDAIPLLIAGSVRVYQIGETGREVTLYRFRPGESCVLTANAILSQQTFPAIATVEEGAEAVMVPADIFRDWVGRYETWRDFFIDLVSQRLSSLMELVDEVAFHRLDRRVASFLLGKFPDQNPIRITHQEIASELGSSREVISRVLEDFDSRKIIRTARGEIEILDPERLDRTTRT